MRISNSIWLLSSYTVNRHLPKVICNSFPKSGTHFLRQIIIGIPCLKQRIQLTITMYEKTTGARRSAAELVPSILRMRPGEIRGGHLFAEQEFRQIFARSDFRHIFPYRDLRDLVVSHAMLVTYGKAAKGHVLRDYYRQELKIDSERIKCSIMGLGHSAMSSYWEGTIEFPDISSRFRPYKRWLSEPHTCVVKFEELIDERIQEKALDRILAYLDLGYRSEILPEIKAKMIENINPRKSPTFRKGKVGDWRNHFTEEHKVLFKEIAGQDLIDMGYEDDLDW